MDNYKRYVGLDEEEKIVV